MGSIFTREYFDTTPTPAELEAYECNDHIRLGKLLRILEHKEHFIHIVNAVFRRAAADYSTARLTLLKDRYNHLIDPEDWNAIMRISIDNGYIDLFDLSIDSLPLSISLQLICSRNQFDLLRHVLEKYPVNVNEVEPLTVYYEQFDVNITLDNLLDTCVAVDALECFDQLIIAGIDYLNNDGVFTDAINHGSHRMAIRLFDLGAAKDYQIVGLVDCHFDKKRISGKVCYLSKPDLTRIISFDTTEDSRVLKRLIKINPLYEKVVRREVKTNDKLRRMVEKNLPHLLD